MKTIPAYICCVLTMVFPLTLVFQVAHYAFDQFYEIGNVAWEPETGSGLNGIKLSRFPS